MVISSSVDIIEEQTLKGFTSKTRTLCFYTSMVRIVSKHLSEFDVIFKRESRNPHNHKGRALLASINSQCTRLEIEVQPSKSRSAHMEREIHE